MKRKYLKITTAILAVLLIAFIGWRIWPRSLSDIISADPASMTCSSATARIGGIKDGEPYSDSYHMSADQVAGECLKGILDLLDSSAYQADVRNLFPWPIDHVEADKNYDDRSVFIVLENGQEIEDDVTIQFLSSSIIAVRHYSDPGFMIYHPTDRNLLGFLIEYIQEYGDENMIERSMEGSAYLHGQA